MLRIDKNVKNEAAITGIKNVYLGLLVKNCIV